MKTVRQEDQTPPESEAPKQHRPPSPPASVVARNGAASTDEAYSYWFGASSEPQTGGGV